MLSFLHSKRDGGTVDLEKCSKAIQVSDKMKGVMYFTWKCVQQILEQVAKFYFCYANSKVKPCHFKGSKC